MVSWFKKLLARGSRKSNFLDPDGGLALREKFLEAQVKTTEPWAMFEVAGFDEKEERIKMVFNWNSAFIEHLNGMGFTGETEDDTVQAFFFTSQMAPAGSDPDGDESVQVEDLPNLSNRVNKVSR